MFCRQFLERASLGAALGTCPQKLHALKVRFDKSQRRRERPSYETEWAVNASQRWQEERQRNPQKIRINTSTAGQWP